MKKLLASSLSLALLLSSCSVFGKSSEIDFNNRVVEQINETSILIEESATLYNESIPDLVTESSEIDTEELSAAHETAQNSLEKSKDLLLLESRNIEQQNAVLTELETYQSAGIAYLDLYADMVDYYQTGSYKEDLTLVQTLDEELHTHYTTFIQANNDLVEILEGYVAAP